VLWQVLAIPIGDRTTWVKAKTRKVPVGSPA
jgi:hypothetical protein